MPFGQILPYYRPQHVVVREPVPTYHENPWLQALRTVATQAAASKIRGMIEEGIKQRLQQQILEEALKEKQIQAASSILREKLKQQGKLADVEGRLATKGIVPAKMGQPGTFQVGGKEYTIDEALLGKLQPTRMPSTYEGFLVNMASKGLITPQQLDQKLIQHAARKYAATHKKEEAIPKTVKSYPDYLWHLVRIGKMTPLEAASGQVTYELSTKNIRKKPLSPATQTYLYLVNEKGLSPLEALKQIQEIKTAGKRSQTPEDIFKGLLGGDQATSSKPPAKTDEAEKLLEEFEKVKQSWAY